MPVSVLMCGFAHNAARRCAGRCALIPVLAAILGTVPVTAQEPNDYGVYRDSPRIALTQQRLRLLERERERQSLRWDAFEALIAGGAAMPEPGLAWSLFYKVTKDRAAGRRAVDWALGDTSDLRQLAFVYDWTSPVMTAAETGRLGAKIEAALARPATDFAGHNARVLGAIAIADRLPDHADAAIREAVRYWRASGAPREQWLALFEMLHAIRDNTQVDLRESAKAAFEALPLDYLMGHYPAPFPSAENEYRIPVYVSDREPDVRAAAMSRAAGLALVAYDTNALNHQYVQGWLLNDRFLMRSAFGAPYEFLWANPYQPGLAYDTLAPLFHDPLTGRVFARTSWADDATWLGYFDGRLQMFRNGGIQTLREGAAIAPIRVGEATVAGAEDRAAAKLRIETPSLFVLGLAPGAEYGVEVDDQELALGRTDVGGTLLVKVEEGVEAGVRLRQR